MTVQFSTIHVILVQYRTTNVSLFSVFHDFRLLCTNRLEKHSTFKVYGLVVSVYGHCCQLMYRDFIFEHPEISEDVIIYISVCCFIILSQ